MKLQRLKLVITPKDYDRFDKDPDLSLRRVTVCAIMEDGQEAQSFFDIPADDFVPLFEISMRIATKQIKRLVAEREEQASSSDRKEKG
jgi:hypothetical protein